MSVREQQRRKISSCVMKEAWRLMKNTVLYRFSFSAVLRLSWSIIRGQIRKHCTKVSGVTFMGRQKLLERLLHCPASQIIIELTRQHENPYDEFATLVVATVKNKGKFCIGYLSSQLSTVIAPIIDSGHQVVIITFDITGGGNKLYGCNLSYIVV